MTITWRVRVGVKAEARRRRCRNEVESLEAEAARPTITKVMPFRQRFGAVWKR